MKFSVHTSKVPANMLYLYIE